MLDSRSRGGTLYLRLRDTSRGGPAGTQPDYWRALTNVGARIVTVTAADDAGIALPVEKVDLYTWRVANVRERAVTVRYRYFADQLDAGHRRRPPPDARRARG